MSKIKKFEIRNSKGMSLKALNYGAIISELNIPGNGGSRNIVLGYSNTSDYLTDEAYIGAVAGRYANRIGGAQFELDGENFRLSANEGKNQLHGGDIGFNKVYWIVNKMDPSTLKFHYLSKDLEEGFPGNLRVEVTYHISEENELDITYRAITDKPTVINVTQHSYFNLNGDPEVLNFGDNLQINSREIVEPDEELIPTGRIKDIRATVLDFSKRKNLGPFLKDLSKDLKDTKGFDHCYVFPDNDKFKHMATLTGGESGIQMDVYSTEPGLQLYSGNHLQAPFKPYSAVCLETQHFPDSPNNPKFPSTRLDPGETYESRTVYKFRS